MLVQRSEAITKTASGIVIPEKAQTKVLQATVIAVGPGARNQVRKIIVVSSISLHHLLVLPLTYYAIFSAR